MNNDLISRSELIKAFEHLASDDYENPLWYEDTVFRVIDNAPTVELTEEQAIDKLHETGWLIRHDKEMTERPQDEWYITPDRQITIEEYMQSLKGENQ